MALAPPILPVKSVRQNRRWIPAVLMAALFLSGGVIGAGLAAIAIHSQAEILLNREKLPDMILLMIQNDLGIQLTPEQMEQVKTILESRQDSLRNLRHGSPSALSIMSTTCSTAQVGGVLDASQRENGMTPSAKSCGSGFRGVNIVPRLRPNRPCFRLTASDERDAVVTFVTMWHSRHELPVRARKATLSVPQ